MKPKPRSRPLPLPTGYVDPYQVKLKPPPIIKVRVTEAFDPLPWHVFPCFEKRNLEPGAEREAELGMPVAAFRSKEAAESFIDLFWPSPHLWYVLYLPGYIDPD